MIRSPVDARRRLALPIAPAVVKVNPQGKAVGARRPRGTGAASDPSFSSVVLLLPLDGANGSTTFTDASASPKTVTAAGGVALATAQVKYGTASAYFDGANDSLSVADSVATQVGAGDFTIEGWVMYTGGGINGYDSVFTLGAGSNVLSLRFADGGSGNVLQLNDFTGDSNSINTDETRATMLNRWAHFAVSCQAGTIRLFIDGTLKGSKARAASFANGRFVIGNWPEYSFWFNGHLDDVRFTKGIARYTAAFTPPTAAHPTS